MNPLVAYFLFVLAMITAACVSWSAWWGAAIFFVLFFLLLGQWVAVKASRLIRHLELQRSIRRYLDEQARR